MSNEVGSLVEGRVVDIVKFGAFVKIKGGKTGLVHISQISEKFVREVTDYVSVGSEVIAKIMSVDDKGRVQLSIKDVTPEEREKFTLQIAESGQKPDDSPEQRHETEIYQQPVHQPARDFRDHRDNREPREDNFETKLKRFLRQSEDRLVDIKRSNESKRSGGKRKK